MAPAALVVPLGKAAGEAVAFLAVEGLVDPARCLLGFPHPSGANGWRARQYAAMRPILTSEITRWAATIGSGRPARPLQLPPSVPRAPSRRTSQPDATPVPGTGRTLKQDGARIVISLTEGGLRNGYVSLADHLGFFPPDAIGAASAKEGTGALLTLHFDGLPGSVQTDIAAGHKIFRSRSPWRRFFSRHSLTAGASIAIERLSAYEYRITPVR